MTKKIPVEIRDEVRETVESVVRERFDVILRKLDALQKTMDVGFGDADTDRRDFAKMITDQATIAEAVKQLIALSSTNNKKLTEKMVDRTEEAMENAADIVAHKVEPVITTVMQKMKVGIKLKEHIPWWQFWKKT